MIDTVEVGEWTAGERAAGEWLRHKAAPVPARRTEAGEAAAGAARLDRERPGWWRVENGCDPALDPHELGRLTVAEAPELDETKSIGAWMHEIALRLAQS